MEEYFVMKSCFTKKIHKINDIIIISASKNKNKHILRIQYRKSQVKEINIPYISILFFNPVDLMVLCGSCLSSQTSYLFPHGNSAKIKLFPGGP